MAEERLIDDDKDKKYRFRINEKGEEELIIDDGANEDAPAEEAEISFDEAASEYQFSDDGTEGEEITAAQREKLSALLDSARADVDEGRYSTALESIETARAILPEDGELCALRLEAYTCRFTEYPDRILPDAADAARDVKKYSSAQAKKDMFSRAGGKLRAMIAQLKEQAQEVSAVNEQKKAERAEIFLADRKKALVRFICAAVPFVAFLVLACVFSTMLFADMTGRFIVLTAVFGGLAFISFIILAFMSRFLNIAARRVRLNRDNSRTEIGRKYLAISGRLDALQEIYDCLSE